MFRIQHFQHFRIQILGTIYVCDVNFLWNKLFGLSYYLDFILLDFLGFGLFGHWIFSSVFIGLEFFFGLFPRNSNFTMESSKRKKIRISLKFLSNFNLKQLPLVENHLCMINSPKKPRVPNLVKIGWLSIFYQPYWIRHLGFLQSDVGFVITDPQNPRELNLVEIGRLSKFSSAILDPPSWICEI